MPDPQASAPASEEGPSPELRRQAALLRLSTGIFSAQDEDEICARVAEGLRDRALGYDFLGIFLLDPATGDRVLKAAVGWKDVSVGLRIPPGTGISDRAMREKALRYTPRVAEAEGYMPGLGTGSEVDLPLLIDGSVLGVMVVESTEPDHFGPEDFEILTSAAQQASIAIVRARLLEEERRRVAEREALLETIADLSTELELSSLLDSVLRRAVELLDAVGGELAILEEDGTDLVVAAVYGVGPSGAGGRLAPGEGALGHVVQTRKPLILPDYQSWEGRSDQYATIPARAVAAAPLIVAGRPVGAVNIWHEDPEVRFGERDLELLSLFGQQAAVAIDNARLFSLASREKEFLKAVMENSPVAIVTVDREARVTSVNPAFEHLFGYSSDEVIGKNLDELISDASLRSEAVSFTQKAKREIGRAHV